MSEWYLYIIRTKDNTLYTGITTNVEKRFSAHSRGKGAKFLRGKGPLKLEFSVLVGTKREALKIEFLLKKQTKTTKENIIKSGSIETLLSIIWS